MGFADSALAYFRQALPLQRALGDRGGEATTLGNIGVVFEETGRRDSALAYLRQALPLQRALGSQSGEAAALHNIGAMFEDTGRPDSALAYYAQALPLTRASGNRRGEATTLTDIGGVFSKTGRPDLALAYFQQALPLTRAVGDRDGEATTLSYIGEGFGRDRRSDSALAYFRQALPLFRRVGDRDGEATTLANIGSVFAGTGRPDSALADFRQALPLFRAVGDRDGDAGTLGNMGVVFARTDRRDSALFYFEASAVLHAAIRHHVGSDAGAIAFAEQQGRIGDAWAAAWLATDRGGRSAPPEVEPRVIAGALGAAERVRAQGLRDLLAAAARDRAMVDGATATTARPLGVVASDTLAGGDLPAEAADALAPLRTRHAAALYYLISEDTLTAWLLTSTGRLTLAGRTALRRDSLAVLVAMLRAGFGAEAARGQMARTARGGPVEQERTVVGASRGVAVEGDTARARAALQALAGALIPPTLTQLVPSGTELVVVPHALLGLVPFAALPLAAFPAHGDTLPLGIQYALRYAPSLRAAAAAERRSTNWTADGPAFGTAGTVRGGVPARAPILVVGDPAMPWITDADGTRARLRPLPGARREATAVAARFRAAGTPVQLLLDTAATETAVRAALPAARVVHLATHGFAYGTEARVRDSYIALAPDSAHSGLFTISTLLDEVPPLRADLVVLSACQTGLGQLADAEGTVGFQRALLARGARSVLVSLWSVDDAATGALLTRFYAHWLGPDGRPARSKAVALQQAEADVRSDPQHPAWKAPRYWAAFQLVGAP